jgi:hypothetical protein
MLQSYLSGVFNQKPTGTRRGTDEAVLLHALGRQSHELANGGSCVHCCIAHYENAALAGACTSVLPVQVILTLCSPVC